MPAEAAALFVGAGHDAVTVPDQRMGGQPDSSVAVVGRNEDRAVVTLDLDFADIRSYPPADYAGIIVLRLDKRRILSVIQRLLIILDQQPLSGKLWIVDEATVRMRG